MKIGRVIYDRRRTAGVSRERLGAVVYKSEFHIRDIEIGVLDPLPEEVFAFSQRLKSPALWEFYKKSIEKSNGYKILGNNQMLLLTSKETGEQLVVLAESLEDGRLDREEITRVKKETLDVLDNSYRVLETLDFLESCLGKK